MTTLSAQSAAISLLELIDSPLVDMDIDPDVGLILTNILPKRDALSGGERIILDIAMAVWNGYREARIADLGQLDSSRRKQVLSILIMFYVDADWRSVLA